MLKIGCHLSVSRGYTDAAQTAVSIGANTFQYFSRNPRGGSARAVNEEDIGRFLSYAEKESLLPVLAHAPYTLNAASGTPATRSFAESCMRGDLETLQLLPRNQLVFHPGSATGITAEEGTDYIVSLLNRVLKQEIETTVLLETMSGKGSEIGSDFKQIAAIIERVFYKDKIGVCIDTCHLYSAGYDIVQNLDGVLESFDRSVGLNRIGAVHLNDSMLPFGCRNDRHARIGEGTIGADALIRVINHERLKKLPFYLETPNEPEGFAKEIAFLKSNFSE